MEGARLVGAVGAEPLVRLLYEQCAQDGDGPRRDVVLGGEVHLRRRTGWPGGEHPGLWRGVQPSLQANLRLFWDDLTDT